MQKAVDLGIEIFTIGQYLQPTKNHLSVDRYVTDNEFLDYKEAGLEIGFKVVESGPLVRSSYHADDQINRLNLDGWINNSIHAKLANNNYLPAKLA